MSAVYHYKIIFICCFAVWAYLPLSAQATYPLRVVQNSVEKSIDAIFEEKETVRDSFEAVFYLRKQIAVLHSMSYLEASLESLEQQSDSSYQASVHVGPNYRFEEISIDGIPVDLLKQLNLRLFTVEDKKFNPESFNKLFGDILTSLENNGYPFAQVYLDNFVTQEGTINADLIVDKRQRIEFDSIQLTGSAKISAAFLEQYLGLKKNEAYNQSQILQVRDRLSELPYVQMKEDPRIRFVQDKAILLLNLEDKNASRFNFLIGLLPNSANENKLTITGELTMDLYNKLGKGERTFFEFKRLRPETQEISFNFNYPYILDLPFGIESRFDLFRNAANNLDLDADLGFQYLFKANNYLSIFWNYNSSRLLSIDSSTILNNARLPDRLDVSLNNIGTELVWQDLDYLYNPRKGYQLHMRSTAGLRSLLKNNEILDLQNGLVDFSNAYDSLSLSTYQFQVKGSLSYFIPIPSRSTLLSRITAGAKISEEELYLNEFYRLGGNRLLRGFDEETILSNFYSVLTIEYRFLIGKNSFIQVFGDYGFVQNLRSETFVWDQPYGFGSGISFETAAGIFSLSLALGSEKENPIDFRNAKTHFGYISLF